VDEPGYWDDVDGLLLSKSEAEQGVWACWYDNWCWKLLLVLAPVIE
jgi:hypothetical protein